MAGGRAAGALRDLGFDGRLLLLGEEPEPPYERPPLSKAYLNGELPRNKLFLRPAAYYPEQEIEWRPGVSALALDLDDRRLQLSDGELVRFDRLLLATGSTPTALGVPGAQLPGVLTYRTLEDCERLTAELDHHPQVVVVGGGFLGTELAAAARHRGCRVSLIELAPSLVSPLGEAVGEFCAQLHMDAGVELLLGERVRRFAGTERVELVELESGATVPCDLALICVGARPNSGLAETAGLATDPGVVVDEHCRTASPEVLAAGDIASWWSPRWARRLRLEHYDNAQHQGLYAAQAMLGETAPYDPLPYFWTEQYGVMIQLAGMVPSARRGVVRGDPHSGRFSVFHLEQGRLRGCVAVNRFPDLAAARRLIVARVEVSVERLQDPLFDLRSWSQEVAELAGAPGG